MRLGILTNDSSSHRRGVNVNTGVLCALLCCVALCVRAQTGADTTALRIQLLNGRTGRPVTNQHLVITRKDGRVLEGTAKAGETTDGEGYAGIPNIESPPSEISVSVDAFQPCSKTSRHIFSLAKLRASGVVSENSCRPRITMYPQPGTLIFYVRDETFIEKLRH
jgi:hypothetical protein